MTASLQYPGSVHRGGAPGPFAAPASLNPQIFSPVMGSGSRFGQVENDDSTSPDPIWNPDLDGSRVRDILKR